MRTGGTASAIGCVVKAPSTLGTFLRSFRWGHVRQLDRVSRELLAQAVAGGQRCAERAALGYIFKRQLPQARRVHADDPALAFVAVSSDGGFLPQPTPDAAR